MNIVSFKLMLIKTFFDKWIHIQAIAKECTESAEVISGIDSGWKKKYHINNLGMQKEDI